MTYQPKENEELFEVKPIGVKYICPFCNEGEMLLDINSNNETFASMYNHRCNSCGKLLLLPRVYPYIEWNKVEG